MLFEWQRDPSNVLLEFGCAYFDSIDPGTFSGLTGLEELGLSGNALTSLEAATFTGLVNLKQLWPPGQPIDHTRCADIR
jgi:hypothetical protein